jgi:hypothetical protein
MRILMTMKWDGVTPDQYEKIRKTVNWEGDMPPGAVFHVAGFDKEKNTMRVTDIWESAEQFNSFIQNRLTPKTQEAGIQGQPQVDIVPVHAIFVPALQRMK